MKKCEICGRELKNNISLSNHISRGHKISICEYYDTYLKKEKNEGVCEICNKNTTFLGILAGYSRYCSVKCAESNPETKKKRQNTNLLIYGFVSPTQSDTVKQKIKNKSIISHNDPYVLEKYKQTMISRYGGYTLQSRILLNKVEQTNIQKFGTKNPFQSDMIKEKIEKTCLKKYGFKNPAQSKETQKKIKNSRIKNGNWISDDCRSDIELYKREVDYYTKLSSKKKYTIEQLDQRSLCGVNNGFQLDHKFSVMEGFKNNILPSIIGSQSNIELIPWLDNTKKK